MTGTSQLEAGCFRYYFDRTMLHLGTSRLMSLLSRGISKALGVSRLTMKYAVLHPKGERLHEGGTYENMQRNMTEEDQFHLVRHRSQDEHLPLRIISHRSGAEVYHDGECVDTTEAHVAFTTSGVLGVGEVVDLEFRQGDETYRCQVKLFYRLRSRYGGVFI
jgi:hypothetical protein